MECRLFDSEFKLMMLLWEYEPISAKGLSILAKETIGWNKNTTYTVIKKLVDKGVIKRTEPDFICSSLVSRADVCCAETKSLIDKLFGGSKTALFSALLEDETLSQEELDELRTMLDKR